jgi:transposase-like protein
MSTKRRQYSAEFKLETVLEGIRGEKPVAQICRERGIRDNLYYKWRDAFQERAPGIFASQEQQDQAVSELETRVAELERMVGKLALENDILKKATHWVDNPARRNGR